MADPFTIGLMAFSTLYSMQAAQDTASMQAQQYEQARKDAILQGKERHNAAIANMSAHLSTNNALAGFMSGDNRSLKRVADKIRKDAATDAGRINASMMAAASQNRLAGRIAVMKGNNAATASLIDGVSSAYTHAALFK
tara:strand:+ start:12809 stop:13225 length:417 start_codon:yes stop_codon:yes gene_type:complete